MLARRQKGRRLYGQITRHKKLTLAALTLGLCCSVILDVALGPSGLSFWDVVVGIVLPHTNDLTRQAIIWDIRLRYEPRR